LRELAVSDFSAVGKARGAFRFTVVPRRLITATPGGLLSLPITQHFFSSAFLFVLPGVSGTSVVSVAGLRAAWPKVAQPPVGTRREFHPGPISFDDIRVEVALIGSTASDLDQWLNQFSLGTGTPKDGEIEGRNQTLTTVLLRVGLFDVSPRFFPPFPSDTNRRTITLSIGRFTLQ
jgi:hypothetical protein